MYYDMEHYKISNLLKYSTLVKSLIKGLIKVNDLSVGHYSSNKEYKV